MATLAVQSVSSSGLTPAYVAAAGGGDKVVPGAGSYIHVKNGDATATVVTLVTPGTVESLAVADRTVSVAAGAEALIAVGNVYKNPTDGLASITYSKVTSLTIGSFRAPVQG
jgi:hypothetical protein